MLRTITYRLSSTNPPSRPLFWRSERLNEDQPATRVRHQHHPGFLVSTGQNVRAVTRRLHPRLNRAGCIRETEGEIFTEHIPRIPSCFGAKLRRGVGAAENEVIENAVVVPRRLVEGKKPPEKAVAGHFQGESFIVPL